MSKKAKCTPDQLNAMTVEELRKEAADRDIPNRSTMNKEELVHAICECDSPGTSTAGGNQEAGVKMPGDGSTVSQPVGQGNPPESITSRTRPIQADEEADHVHGTLFACDGQKLSIMHEDAHREGKGFECEPDCPVIVNGQETNHQDLRRGDRVTCVRHKNGKIKAIIAHR